MFQFKLPDVGEGVAEGEVVKWHVKEGDQVKENQPLVEIMTDKVNVEIPSPRAGKIARLYAKEGEVVKVGAPLLDIDDAGAPLGEKQVPPRTVEAAKPEPAPPVAPSRAAPPVVGAGMRKAEAVLATPATRKLARDLGVDLTQVTGTGPSGRVSDSDVRQFAERGVKAVAQATVAVTAPRAEGGEERIPLRGLRRRIAEKMVKSKHTIPHVTHFEEIDLTELVELREKAKSIAEKRGIRLTYLPFIMKALVPALRKYPYLNASLDDQAGEVILKKYYNIGVATATDQGLVVPVVKDVDKKTIFQIAQEIELLAQKARTGQLSLEEIQGGTFTVTNVGALGGLIATPIINHPEVAVLGTHRITKRPVVRDGNIVIRDIMYVSLSFDHRVLDGAIAAEFATALKEYLEDPKLFLLEILENV